MPTGAPQRSATVLLVVDMVNPMQFDGASSLLQAALPAAHHCARLKKRLSRQGCATVYANDNYGRWRSDFKQLLHSCQALRGARGEIATLLAPDEDDLILLKPLHSAFHCTPLEPLLKQMQTRELVIVGVATDMCVQLTAMDACMRGFTVWVPSNCTAAQSEERKQMALRQLRQAFKCSVRKA